LTNIGTIRVPNEVSPRSKILIVGEAPGSEEESQRKPFVGISGDILISVLGRAGVSRSEVTLANLCQYRPLPDNKFERLLGSKQLDEGKAELYALIHELKPNIIIPLGNNPLQCITGKQSISRWRGSIILAGNIKCIPTYHPAAVARDRSLYPIFDLDIRRAVEDSKFPEPKLPERKYVLNPQGMELEEYVQLLSDSDRIAVDIETIRRSRHILCVGFAPHSKLGVSINAEDVYGQLAIRRILESPAKKIFHFGSFDTAQLKLNGYNVENYWWDTLVAQHALNPELPRALDFLCSIYTRQPYYKKEGRGEIPGDVKSWGLKEDKLGLFKYNATDVCVTAEIQKEQELELEEDQLARGVFDFEMEELEMTLDISLTGMLRDEERKMFIHKAIATKRDERQYILNGLSEELVNVRSPKLKTLLYEKLGLPTRRNRNGGVTTDEDAIVSLIGYCKDGLNSVSRPDAVLNWKVKLAICQLILEIRGIRQLISNYMKPTNDDGRVRSTYKCAATETGRWSAEKFVDGTGINSQTVPREALDIPEEIKEDINVIDEDEDGDSEDEGLVESGSSTE